MYLANIKYLCYHEIVSKQKKEILIGFWNWCKSNWDLSLNFLIWFLLTVADYLPDQKFESGLLTKLFITLLLFFILGRLKDRQILKDLESATSIILKKEFDKGLILHYSHETAPPRYEMIIKAEEKVSIVSTNLYSFFYTDPKVKDIVEAKLKRKCKFRIVIYTPNTHGIREKQWEESDNYLQKNIIDSCDLYLGPLRKKFPKLFEIKFISINLPFALTIIDETYMFVSLNLPGQSRRKRQTPRLEILPSHPFFAVYLNAFEKIWNDKTYTSSAVPDSLKSYFRNSQRR